jgi:hypothetical protein
MLLSLFLPLRVEAGDELEYADEVTLGRSIQRVPLKNHSKQLIG